MPPDFVGYLLRRFFTMSTADQIAGISAVIAIASAVISGVAVHFARKAAELSKQMFLRGTIFDLDSVWATVRSIHPTEPDTEDAVTALRAMTLTASCWNHEIVEKSVLSQTRWETFCEVYESFEVCTVVIPGLKKKGSDLLDKGIRSAYAGMKAFQTKAKTETGLPGT